jgi:hypothetical protein
MSMTIPSRILAVEIRAARLGYAVFEKPRELRNFGAAWFTSSSAARSRITRLLRLYRPSLLVLRGGVMRYPRNVPNRKRVARMAFDEARKLRVPVARVLEQEFVSFFERHSCRDKYDIAALLAKWLPDLAWRVPSRPKFYDPEPRSILYFDSIALGIVYLEFASNGDLKGNEGVLSPASKLRSQITGRHPLEADERTTITGSDKSGRVQSLRPHGIDRSHLRTPALHRCPKVPAITIDCKRESVVEKRFSPCHTCRCRR